MKHWFFMIWHDRNCTVVLSAEDGYWDCELIKNGPPELFQTREYLDFCEESKAVIKAQPET